MKKRLLIVYSKMIVGGSTTSLLSLLNEFDYQQYEVDLLLYEKGGALDSQIPAEVNVLDNAFLHTAKKTLSYKSAFVGAYIKSKLAHNPLIRSQIMSKKLAESMPVLAKKYDVAASYLEFWASNYVHQKVNADKKILWLHVDYSGARLDIKYDRKMYSEADAVITVSEACNENFKKILPENKNIICVNNILSARTIEGFANEYEPDVKLYNADFVFVTVARIVFNHKGHNRGVAAFKKIKELYPDKSFKWLIIGDGPDRDSLQELIKSAELEEEIVLLGEMNNPHPYVKKSDIFFLPSHYEGKPMSVTEAQMNGAVPFVTNYASAHGQIDHMQDGVICENDDNAIYDMLSSLFAGEIDFRSMKERISQKDYSNRDEITKIYELLK